ncbi:MAG TPA: hypothetical protein DEO57_03540 [Phycisphaerales bacterium]|nr:hypothetical protein [Phycisphaerales bacterium]
MGFGIVGRHRDDMVSPTAMSMRSTARSVLIHRLDPVLRRRAKTQFAPHENQWKSHSDLNGAIRVRKAVG